MLVDELDLVLHAQASGWGQPKSRLEDAVEIKDVEMGSLVGLQLSILPGKR